MIKRVRDDFARIVVLNSLRRSSKSSLKRQLTPLQERAQNRETGAEPDKLSERKVPG